MNRGDDLDMTAPMQTRRNRTNADFLKAELKDFLGSKLAAVVVDHDEGEGWLGLVFSRVDGQQWVGWIQSDAEGNAPGFINLLKAEARPKPWPKVGAPAQFTAEAKT